MPSRCALLTFAISLAACDGCSDDHDGDASDGGSGGSRPVGNGGAPASTVTNGTGGDGGQGGAGGGAPNAAIRGRLSLSSTPDEYWRFEAKYDAIVGAVTYTEVGPCQITEYPTTAGLFGPSVSDVGLVIVDYGGLEPLVLEPPAEYVFFAAEPAPFDAGSAISMDVEGGSGIAPQHADLVFPEGIVVTSPALENLVIDRAQDFEISWTGGSHRVNVALSSEEPLGGEDVHRIDIRCSFDAAAGLASLPSEALMFLLPGEGGMVVNVTDSVDIVQSESIVTELKTLRLAERPDGSTTSLFAIALE